MNVTVMAQKTKQMLVARIGEHEDECFCADKLMTILRLNDISLPKDKDHFFNLLIMSGAKPKRLRFNQKEYLDFYVDEDEVYEFYTSVSDYFSKKKTNNGSMNKPTNKDLLHLMVFIEQLKKLSKEYDLCDAREKKLLEPVQPINSQEEVKEIIRTIMRLLAVIEPICKRYRNYHEEDEFKEMILNEAKNILFINEYFHFPILKDHYFRRESMSKHMIRINRKQRKITKGKEMTL